MKEILKYYLTIRTSLLDNIFSKSEEEKKKILKNLIILYLIFTITPEIISFFTPIWKLSYGLWSILSWIPPYVLFIKNIILNLLFICIWAYLSNFLLKKFWEKDWFLVFFIWWFYWSIFIILAFILKELLPYLIWIINENNAWIFSILFMIFGFWITVLAIWWLVLALVLYINRLKWFWNFIKYVLAYIILWLIIYLPIGMIEWWIIGYITKTNIENKFWNFWNTNSTTINSSNFYWSQNTPSLTTSFWEENNDYKKTNSWILENTNTGNIENNLKETNSGSIKKIEENKVLENNTTFSEEDEKASKVRDSFRKIYLNSINKSIKSYFEKNSDYPEKLEEISEVENLKNKFKEKFGEFKSKNWCNFDINYEKNNWYTLKICLENDKDFELKN